MAVSKQVQEFSDRVNVATNRLAADIKALKDRNVGVLSPEDQAVLDGVATKLEGIAADAEDPVPTV